VTEHSTITVRYRQQRRSCARLSLWLLLALTCLFTVNPSWARETRIIDTRTLLVDGVYRLGAHVDFDFNDTLNDALHNGVPLLIELRIEVLRDREWLWPEMIAELRQRFKLEFHALSRRYLVKNFSTGGQLSFATLDGALNDIGNVYDLPLIDAQLLSPEQKYLVRMRADIDVEALPTPVRLWAYLGSEWSLKSKWYEWRLQP
jgi:hypothetical protein